MAFNPRLISLKNSTGNPKMINLATIIEMGLEGDLDFNAPYQRDESWNELMREYLILSIMNERPINTIYLVSKGNCTECWVLDGKQRLTAIMAFINNEFEVTLTLENGQTYTVRYRDLKDKNHPCHFLLSKIKMYQVWLVKTEFMSFEEQGELFALINANEPQNDNERIYCARFLALKVLKYIFDNDWPAHQFFQGKAQRDNARFAGIRVLHNLLVLAYGVQLNDQYASRDLSMPNIIEAAQFLHDKCVSSGVDGRTVVNEEIIDKLGLQQMVKDLRETSKWFKDIVMSVNGLKKGKLFEKNLVVFFMAFLLKKKREQILTSSMFKDVEVSKQLLNVLTNYAEKRKTDKIYTHSTQLASTIKLNMDVIEEEFSKTTIDKGVKNKRLSPNDKALAAVKAATHCAITGKPLTDDNVQYDHQSAKAASSVNTKINVLSSDGNRLKADLSRQASQNITEVLS